MRGKSLPRTDERRRSHRFSGLICILHQTSSHASSAEDMLSSKHAMTLLLPWHIIIGHVDAKEALVRNIPLAQRHAWPLHNAIEQRLDDLSCPFSWQRKVSLLGRDLQVRQTCRRVRRTSTVLQKSAKLRDHLTHLLHR